MKRKGFDNDTYLKLQSEHIQERIASFDGKLYLEFGGKLFDDFHASRVLPGFLPDSKLKMLLQLKDQAEIVIAVNAQHIEDNKLRADLGISYEDDVLRLIDAFHDQGLYVGSVCITRYDNQKSVKRLEHKLERKGIPSYHHYTIEGYPFDADTIISEAGFGRNEYIHTTKPLVVVTAPGPGSGKMATCLSQLYHEHQKGVRAGYAKYETFPIWSIPLNHPVNLAYEAATADLNDENMIDPYHLEAYGREAVNYNRDIEIFPVLRRIFERISGSSPYQSPTDMGVNMAGFAICDDEACRAASHQEIIRRYFATRNRLYDDQCSIEEMQKQKMLMAKAGLSEEDRRPVKAAREKEALRGCWCGAIEMEDGTMITSSNTDFMGPCAGLVINALKYLAGIEDAYHLISDEAFMPIQKLKTKYLHSSNPRLHTTEMLIALSLSAKTDPLAARALEQLEKLDGLQAHITCDVSPVDLNAYSTLGIQLTYETEKK